MFFVDLIIFVLNLRYLFNFFIIDHVVKSFMVFYKYGDLFVKIVTGNDNSLFRTLAILLKSMLLLRVMISYCRCKTIVYVAIITIIKSVAI